MSEMLSVRQWQDLFRRERFRIDPVSRSAPGGMTGSALILPLPAGCSGTAGLSWGSRSLLFWTITMSG